MDESVIKKFYEKLVNCLPMDDAKFRASLQSTGLFPGDLKESVMSKPTSAAMAEHFLDHGINNDIQEFSKLLTVMKSSKYDRLKVLVDEIQKETSCVKADVIQPIVKQRVSRSEVVRFIEKRRAKTKKKKVNPLTNKRKIKNVQPSTQKRELKSVSQCTAQKRKAKHNYMRSIYPLDVTQPLTRKRKNKNVTQHAAKKRKVQVSMLSEVQNMLKTAYKRICNSDHPHYYVQLALVRDEVCSIRDKKLNEITKHTLQGQVDEILKIKEPLKEGLMDIFHYKGSTCPRLILIMGAPGIGKSTLVNEICLKWAENKVRFLSNEYDLVILIQLRTIQERTLQQALVEAVGSEAAYNELLTNSHGKKCLIILEGLDEISVDWQENDSVFCKLVKSTVFLSHANILVTSRPHACEHLLKDIKGHTRTIEIVGFDKRQIKEYAEVYLSNSSTAEKFMEQVDNDPGISSLCYVPLCLKMVLQCFKDNNETLHTTLTELYQSFITSTVEEHIKFKEAVSLGPILKSDKQYFKNLRTVLSSVHDKKALNIMFLLSKLAYKSYFEWYDEKVTYCIKRNPKIIYTKTDLAHCNITTLGNDACGLLKATITLFGVSSNTAVYTFNHLSVQEYFCALYISLLPEDRQLQLLKDHINIDYPHMWPFYAGITKLKSSDVLDYLYQFLLPNKQLLNTDFIDCNKTPCGGHRDQIPVVLNSIFEAQLSSSVCSEYPEALLVMPLGMHPYDFMSISYFMSVASVSHLFLDSCSIGDQKLEMLAKYKANKGLLPSLKMLNLSYNDYMTLKGMESVVKVIESNRNLTHFSVTCNPIGDDGIQLFSLLKLKHLIQLNISYIRMTEVGTCALGEYLKISSSLQSLEMSHNDIKDSGLTEILNNLPSSLIRLIVSGCSLTCNGAVNIGKMLSVNVTLKHLKISSNFIGDDGISAISDGLLVNTTLIQLIARRCQFRSQGAESIAKMLKMNKTLKCLDISSNHIGDNGIKSVTNGIQINTSLIQLKIFNCKGIEGIAEMLMVNKTLKELGITYGDDVIPVLKVYRRSDCKLAQLNIAAKKTDDKLIRKYATSPGDKGAFYNNPYYYLDYYDYDGDLQRRCIVKKCNAYYYTPGDYYPFDDYPPDDYYTIANYLDNHEEWFIGDDLAPVKD